MSGNSSDAPENQSPESQSTPETCGLTNLNLQSPATVDTNSDDHQTPYGGPEKANSHDSQSDNQTVGGHCLSLQTPEKLVKKKEFEVQVQVSSVKDQTQTQSQSQTTVTVDLDQNLKLNQNNINSESCINNKLLQIPTKAPPFAVEKFNVWNKINNAANWISVLPSANCGVDNNNSEAKTVTVSNNDLDVNSNNQVLENYNSNLGLSNVNDNIVLKAYNNLQDLNSQSQLEDSINNCIGKTQTQAQGYDESSSDPTMRGTAPPLPKLPQSLPPVHDYFPLPSPLTGPQILSNNTSNCNLSFTNNNSMSRCNSVTMGGPLNLTQQQSQPMSMSYEQSIGETNNLNSMQAQSQLQQLQEKADILKQNAQSSTITNQTIIQNLNNLISNSQSICQSLNLNNSSNINNSCNSNQGNSSVQQQVCQQQQNQTQNNNRSDINNKSRIYQGFLGKIRMYNPSKGWGFLHATDTSQFGCDTDIFLHQKHFLYTEEAPKHFIGHSSASEKQRQLEINGTGVWVTFSLSMRDRRKPEAVHVRKAEKPHLRPGESERDLNNDERRRERIEQQEKENYENGVILNYNTPSASGPFSVVNGAMLNQNSNMNSTTGQSMTMQQQSQLGQPGLQNQSQQQQSQYNNSGKGYYSGGNQSNNGSSITNVHKARRQGNYNESKNYGQYYENQDHSISGPGNLGSANNSWRNLNQQNQSQSYGKDGSGGKSTNSSQWYSYGKGNSNNDRGKGYNSSFDTSGGGKECNSGYSKSNDHRGKGNTNSVDGPGGGNLDGSHGYEKGGGPSRGGFNGGSFQNNIGGQQCQYDSNYHSQNLNNSTVTVVTGTNDNLKYNINQQQFTVTQTGQTQTEQAQQGVGTSGVTGSGSQSAVNTGTVGSGYNSSTVVDSNLNQIQGHIPHHNLQNPSDNTNTINIDNNLNLSNLIQNQINGNQMNPNYGLLYGTSGILPFQNHNDNLNLNLLNNNMNGNLNNMNYLYNQNTTNLGAVPQSQQQSMSNLNNNLSNSNCNLNSFYQNQGQTVGTCQNQNQIHNLNLSQSLNFSNSAVNITNTNNLMQQHTGPQALNSNSTTTLMHQQTSVQAPHNLNHGLSSNVVLNTQNSSQQNFVSGLTGTLSMLSPTLDSVTVNKDTAQRLTESHTDHTGAVQNFQNLQESQTSNVNLNEYSNTKSFPVQAESQTVGDDINLDGNFSVPISAIDKLNKNVNGTCSTSSVIVTNNTNSNTVTQQLQSNNNVNNNSSDTKSENSSMLTAQQACSASSDDEKKSSDSLRLALDHDSASTDRTESNKSTQNHCQNLKLTADHQIPCALNLDQNVSKDDKHHHEQEDDKYNSSQDKNANASGNYHCTNSNESMSLKVNDNIISSENDIDNTSPPRLKLNINYENTVATTPYNYIHRRNSMTMFNHGAMTVSASHHQGHHRDQQMYNLGLRPGPPGGSVSGTNHSQCHPSNFRHQSQSHGTQEQTDSNFERGSVTVTQAASYYKYHNHNQGTSPNDLAEGHDHHHHHYDFPSLSTVTDSNSSRNLLNHTDHSKINYKVNSQCHGPATILNQSQFPLTTVVHGQPGPSTATQTHTAHHTSGLLNYPNIQDPSAVSNFTAGSRSAPAMRLDNVEFADRHYQYQVTKNNNQFRQQSEQSDSKSYSNIHQRCSATSCSILSDTQCPNHSNQSGCSDIYTVGQGPGIYEHQHSTIRQSHSTENMSNLNLNHISIGSHTTRSMGNPNYINTTNDIVDYNDLNSHANINTSELSLSLTNPGTVGPAGPTSTNTIQAPRTSIPINLSSSLNASPGPGQTGSGTGHFGKFISTCPPGLDPSEVQYGTSSGKIRKTKFCDTVILTQTGSDSDDQHETERRNTQQSTHARSSLKGNRALHDSSAINSNSNTLRNSKDFELIYQSDSCRNNNRSTLTPPGLGFDEVTSPRDLMNDSQNSHSSNKLDQDLDIQCHMNLLVDNDDDDDTESNGNNNEDQSQFQKNFKPGSKTAPATPYGSSMYNFVRFNPPTRDPPLPPKNLFGLGVGGGDGNSEIQKETQQQNLKTHHLCNRYSLNYNNNSHQQNLNYQNLTTQSMQSYAHQNHGYHTPGPHNVNSMIQTSTSTTVSPGFINSDSVNNSTNAKSQSTRDLVLDNHITNSNKVQVQHNQFQNYIHNLTNSNLSIQGHSSVPYPSQHRLRGGPTTVGLNHLRHHYNLEQGQANVGTTGHVHGLVPGGPPNTNTSRFDTATIEHSQYHNNNDYYNLNHLNQNHPTSNIDYETDLSNINNRDNVQFEEPRQCRSNTVHFQGLNLQRPNNTHLTGSRTVPLPGPGAGPVTDYSLNSTSAHLQLNPQKTHGQGPTSSSDQYSHSSRLGQTTNQNISDTDNLHQQYDINNINNQNFNPRRSGSLGRANIISEWNIIDNGEDHDHQTESDAHHLAIQVAKACVSSPELKSEPLSIAQQQTVTSTAALGLISNSNATLISTSMSIGSGTSASLYTHNMANHGLQKDLLRDSGVNEFQNMIDDEEHTQVDQSDNRHFGLKH